MARLIRGGFAGPVEVRAAAGHGRSYGTWSAVLGRALPPIRDCGLWQALAAAPRSPTFALLTDVGNDLMFGSAPATVAGWVDECLGRLAAAGATTVVTRLPVARLERLSAARYHAARLAFFPKHGALPWAEMLGRVRDLDERVATAAARHGAAIVTPPRNWYGFDPIHIRWSRRTAAWSDILGHWPTFATTPARRGVPYAARAALRPERYRLLGRDRAAPQPALRWNDVTLSLY